MNTEPSIITAALDIQYARKGYYAVWYENETLRELRVEGPFPSAVEAQKFAELCEAEEAKQVTS